MKWIILLLLLIPFASASSSDNYAINALAISGGGTNITSASYDLNLLIGTTAGVTENENYTASLGFWFGEDYFVGDLVWMIALVLSFLGVIVWLVGWARKSEHKPIQILFTFLAAFLSLAVINIATIVGEIDLNPIMWSIMWATLFSIAIIMIVVFLDIKLYKHKILEKKY
tara:strand:- start:656 stop:1168 length:513 start_codon:yes stop_codon:yes gene_type:complete